MFQEISTYVRTQVPDAMRRKAYSRTLFGVKTSLAIHEWTRESIEELEETGDDEALLQSIWPMLELGIMNGLFRKCTSTQGLLTLAQEWVDGVPAFKLLDLLKAQGVRFGEGERPRRPTIDHVIDICENALAFEGVLVFGAIIEAVRLEGYSDGPILDRLANLQKRLKYGLNGKPAILLHELGFADRILAAELAEVVGSRATTKRRLRRLMRERRDNINGVLKDFPAYFTFVWESVLREGA